MAIGFFILPTSVEQEPQQAPQHFLQPNACISNKAAETITITIEAEAENICVGQITNTKISNAKTT